ncbi:MAG TPA: hypothetical protein VHB79_33390 [Polyangiaceae bacterium]|nr:hypothetical protein [Polyangiaceae bacterium]
MGSAVGVAGSCANDDCPTSKECGPGDVAGCSCGGVEAGHRLCESGAFGACSCPGDGSFGAAGAGPLEDCIAETEWCDGHDNDCNGVVDDHFACHDDAVEEAFTLPFEGGAYFAGLSSDVSCDNKAVQQFWPVLSHEYMNGFDCYVDEYRFRRSDGELFYNSTTRGIVHHTPAAELVEASPCDALGGGFGFDAEGTLYYQCGSKLERGKNEVVADDISFIAGVLDDGRTLVTRRLANQGYVYAVLDEAGIELTRFPPAGLFTGSLEVRPNSTSVVGNRAYTLLVRTYDQVTIELLLYAVDEASVFRLVRRRIVPSAGIAQLALSDGSLFVSDGSLFRGYFPDNTNAVVYRKSEGIFVWPDDSSFSAQLTAGPRMTEVQP